MNRPPPLTREQLIEIRERRKGDPDIKALLWEVQRLRQHALRANQLLGRLKNLEPTTEMIANAFRIEIKDEAIIAERKAEWLEHHTQPKPRT